MQVPNRFSARYRGAFCLAFAYVLIVSVALVSGQTKARAEIDGSAAYDRAEESLAQMAQGQYREAYRLARQSLRMAPDDPLVHSLVGALQLHTGDSQGALASFTAALKGRDTEGLARYGLGLAQLARGDRQTALAGFDRSQKEGGDPAFLLIAQRYAMCLGGVQMSLEGVALPDAMVNSLNALQGVSASNRRDLKAAADGLSKALAAPSRDLVTQSAGLMMSFDPAHPIGITAAPLSKTDDVPKAGSKDRALSGDLSFTPEDVPGSVSFVSYELDGQTLCLMNTSPFAYTWDTRSTTNGWHVLNIIFFDREGTEISRLERKLRIFNAGNNTAISTSPIQSARLRAALWQQLLLRPDRCVCAYLLGVVDIALGDRAAAAKWFYLSAAIDPAYRDVRQQLAALEVGVSPTMWSGLLNERTIALTFDDGPKPEVTEALLNVLKAEQVQATFFVVGRQALLYPDLAKKIADAGMEIANHSFTHPNLTTLQADYIAREVLQAQAAVLFTTGKTPRFLRPPGGNWSTEVAQVVRQCGMTPCFWTVDAYSAEVVGPQQVANLVLKNVKPGAIVLMHNGTMSTVQALPTIIRTLRARGYTFTTVETLSNRLAAAKEAARSAATANRLPGRTE